MTNPSSVKAHLTLAEQFVESASVASPVVIRLASCTQPYWGVDDLEAMVRKDADFSIRLMALANSAFYSQHHTIDTLRMALVVLGDKMVQRVAAGYLITGLAKNSDVSYPKPGSLFVVATMAEQLALAHRKVNAERAFATGLLSFAGQLAVQRFGSDPVVLDGAPHQTAAIGAEVLRLMQLPERLASAVESLIDPANVISAGPLAQTLLLAYDMAAVELSQDLDIHALSTHGNACADALGLIAEDLAVVSRNAADALIADACQFGADDD